MPETVAARTLTPGQRRLVGFAAGLVAFAVSLACIIGAIWGLGWLIGVFSGVLWPLAAAGIAALVLRPVVDALELRARLKRPLAVAVLYALVALAFAGALLLILPPAIRQLVDFVNALPDLWQRALDYVQAHYPQWIELVQRHTENPQVRDALGRLGSEAQGLWAKLMPSLAAAGSQLLGFFGFATQLAIIPIYLFFFLLSRREPTRGLENQLPFLRPELRDDIVFLVREFIAIVVSFFRGQLVIGLLMGVLYATGFSLIGLKSGLFIGLALGFLNIVPYLGTIIGLAITVPLAFLQPEGGIKLVALVLLVQVVVQNIEGWFLTPKIMGDRTGLHPVVIIFAIFFWGTALNGILGMILAIPLTAFWVTAWRFVKRKYFAQPEGRETAATLPPPPPAGA